ncbi:hypothetical protein EGW08_008901 [Elysia chlorotica]|uniref:Uncharacterized protein n=1 Tax=Elysia chlorotica TaxID=188477 RepID=A0A433TP54_ELYCH|nr:hypothetical protein EGW08_008901 [Elysia chlorotica]
MRARPGSVIVGVFENRRCLSCTGQDSRVPVVRPAPSPLVRGQTGWEQGWLGLSGDRGLPVPSLDATTRPSRVPVTDSLTSTPSPLTSFLASSHFSRVKGRQREKIWVGVGRWIGGGKGIGLIVKCEGRDVWRDMVANANRTHPLVFFPAPPLLLVIVALTCRLTYCPCSMKSAAGTKTVGFLFHGLSTFSLALFIGAGDETSAGSDSPDLISLCANLEAWG